MKTYLLLAIIFVSNIVIAQSFQDYYVIAGTHIEKGEFDKAIHNYQKEVELRPDNLYAWFDLGYYQAYLGHSEDAIQSFSKVLELEPASYGALLYRAICYRHLIRYEEALMDLDSCIALDWKEGEAYFQRGIAYEYSRQYDKACEDLSTADDKGVKDAKKLIAVVCNEDRDGNYSNIVELTQNASDESYGYSCENPIKVGTGLWGGPSNQRDYLNLLRDNQGNSIEYERKGSHCAYKSEFAPFGDAAMVDMYAVYFNNVVGEQDSTYLFISFYDYEQPKIPVGFKSSNK